VSVRKNFNGQCISTDMWVKDSDPAACFLGDLEDVSKCDREAIQQSCRYDAKGLEEQSVFLKHGYMTKETVAASDDYERTWW